MRFTFRKVVAAGLFALPPAAIFARQSGPLPYATTQVEPDQEMSPIGVATDEFKGIHIISTRVRGVRGANGVVYWVSSNKEILSAYQGEHLLWRLNVAKAFTPALSQPQIKKLIFCSNTVFVTVNKKGFAEVNRQTGSLGHKMMH